MSAIWIDNDGDEDQQAQDLWHTIKTTPTAEMVVVYFTYGKEPDERGSMEATGRGPGE